jgi:pyruvate dehydrogenase E2 component (dihydrolipoamide acetyltransferase)
MEFEFRLPDLGEGIAEAEIRNWLVEEGEQIAEHQPVVEVETDKALVELPAPKGGRILKHHHLEGAVVAVGDSLLTIDTENGNQERPPSYGIVGELPEAEEAAPPNKQTKTPTAPEPAGEVHALPSVRALAKELHVNLDKITGSGPERSITAEDVRAAADAATKEPGEPKQSEEPEEPVPAAQERLPQQGIRRVIARKLLQSQQLTAFVTTMDEFDVTRLCNLKLREEPQLAERDLHLTFLPFFIKATQHALLEFPRFNARLDEQSNELIMQPDCHMGIAVDTDDGLMVPVLRDIATKSVIRLAEELQRLSEHARQRSIAREDLQGSTFTLTNFGSYGGHFATPIINYPNVAILGCGRIRERPWVVAGELAIRQILPLSLTFDHRVSDGAEASRFLSHIGRYLEDPGLLFIESV